MPKTPRLTPQEAESALLKAGFALLKIYLKNDIRVVIPFHSGKTLHPKIVKQMMRAIEKAG